MRQPTTYLYDGSIREVESILANLNSERPFVVIDETAFVSSGAEAALQPSFAKRSTTWFSKFELNPKLPDVERAVQLFCESQSDVIIAVGGGTAIDIAKLIAALSQQTQPAKMLIRGEAPLADFDVPLVAVPTTAGTGSEATHFAVVYIQNEKFSLAHPNLLPGFVVVDSELTRSLPRSITAATGLDAFCQAIESLWAVGSTEESIAYASEALPLILEHLPTAVHAPNAEARRAMSHASHLAGKAINISRTTAPHAISYAITSRHGYPHGMAVAMTLSRMLQYNGSVQAEDCSDPRGVSFVRRQIDRIVDLLASRTLDEASQKIDSFIAKLGCPTSLQAAGITSRPQIEAIVQEVNAERMSNNPRSSTSDTLLNLLTSGVTAAAS
ncbi:phosphonoacetaldehyde reductase [Blastopirellula sp. JC732]|uniref:Phosphonoacetaldehyde reductase n=1 Tax=Blastopirellula sediminis TaxID=2894196 RepID=A0A9X1MJJ2_9BACT|nr:phosphonoacetaldehyde reductase [Blastopirellula sediminis]MCC9608985.1 phosphonoacetaldehyde reductase [Blastopirellula sediminis]MCC9628238.1 phosphonoacetaldehyde reductase [Blastopirellula sediminis]